MISPQLRAMRLRAVRNKQLSFIRAARKEMRVVSWLDWHPAPAVAAMTRIEWVAFDNAKPDANTVLEDFAKFKVKYGG